MLWVLLEWLILLAVGVSAVLAGINPRAGILCAGICAVALGAFLGVYALVRFLRWCWE